MQTYRKDQGRLARMAAFWGLTLLLLFACMSLHTSLTSGWKDSLGSPIAGFVIPIVSVKVSPAFLISTVLFAAGLIWLLRWQQRPKVADLLIETEAELRKVTWPGPQEVVDSSVVVIICVVFLMAFLSVADWFLGRVFDYLMVGG